MIYNTLVLPHLSYGLEVWGSTYQSYLKDILIIQKKIARIITFSSYNTHSPPLFKRLLMLDVYKQRDYQIGIFVHDVINGNVPPYFSNFFSKIGHCYDTRQQKRNDLSIPKYNNNYGQFSTKFTGAKIWNSIPSHIRDTRSRSTFKANFKSHLLSQY